MKLINILFSALALSLMSAGFLSCSDDVDNNSRNSANAIVTLKTDSARGEFYMQLDDSTTILPTNIKVSPAGKKEVRALVNLKLTKKIPQYYSREAYVNWIDTVRTKNMSQDFGTKNDSIYGNNPLEIVNHWTTGVEDGYLTLRFRTYFRNGSIHRLSLVKTDEPYCVQLFHDAAGDIVGVVRDGVIAFKLDLLPDTEGKTVDLTLKWNSFSGNKSVKFKYCSRK